MKVSMALNKETKPNRNHSIEMLKYFEDENGFMEHLVISDKLQ